MLIACPSPAGSYFVEPASLQPDGSRVCCGSVWRNEPGRAARLLAAAEALAPDNLVADPLVAQWPPNSPAAPAQSADAHAEVAAASEPTNDVSDAPLVGQGVAEGALGELEPARATAAIELDAPPTVPVDLDEGQPLIAVEAESSDVLVRFLSRRDPIAHPR